MKQFALILFLFVVLVGHAQEKQKIPNLKVSYSTSAILKLDPETDAVIERWDNSNVCEYCLNRKKGTCSFLEKSVDGQIVNSWEFPAVLLLEDEETYTFELTTDEGNSQVVFWKDNSMVALSTNEATFLISAYK